MCWWREERGRRDDVTYVQTRSSAPVLFYMYVDRKQEEQSEDE